MKTSSIFILATLILAACGQEPTPTAVSFAPNKAESACFRQQGGGIVLDVVITAFSVPDGCERQTKRFIAEGDAFVAYRTDHDENRLRRSIEAADADMPALYFTEEVLVHSNSRFFVQEYDLTQPASAMMATVNDCRYDGGLATCQHQQTGTVLISAFEDKGSIDLNVDNTHISARYNHAFEDARDYFSAVRREIIRDGM